MVYSYVYKTPFGNVMISEDGEGICEIKLESNAHHGEEVTVKETPLTKLAYTQLYEYFNGERKDFDLKLNPKGTAFQKAAWKELCNIPYGETISYKELATRVGNPKACRAVGLANNRNPIWIIIPCHRVIASDGKLTGYAGGLDMKEALLKLESGQALKKK